MKKKFKNEMAVTGSKPLLKAFSEEVKLFGWKFRWEIDTINSTHIIFDIPEEASCNFANHNANLKTYTLPQDWSKALELAKEVEEEVPEYVKCIKTDTTGVVFTGQIYEVIFYEAGKQIKIRTPKKDWTCYYINVDIPNSTNITEFIRSTKSEYDAQQEEFRKKELLEEAVRKYPIGTKFHPAHLNTTDYCIVTNTEFKICARQGHSEVVCALTNEGRYFDPNSKYGNNTIYDRIVYVKGKWAEIVEDEFKAGDYVLLAGTSTFSGNGIAVEEAIVKLLPLGTLPNPTGNSNPDFEFIWDNSNLGTKKKHIIRLATPSEIEKYKAENEIEIGGYKAEFYHGEDGEILARFGCKSKISGADVSIVKQVLDLSSDLNLSLEFHRGGLKINGGIVSRKTLDKLISKL